MLSSFLNITTDRTIINEITNKKNKHALKHEFISYQLMLCGFGLAKLFICSCPLLKHDWTTHN